MLKSIAALILLTGITVQPVFSQSDNETVIVQAFENLAGGYHFTAESSLTQLFIAPEEEFKNTTDLSMAGDVASNGDYILSTSRTVTTPDVSDAPPLDMELVSVDDVLYVNFQTEGTLYEKEYADFAPGWHRYDELSEQLTDTINGLVLESLVNLQLPSDLLFDDNLIESVTEVESEIVDGVEMRVFDVEMDALGVFAGQSPLTGLEAIEELLRNAEFISKTELSLTYRMWIGAEDGQLYQISGESLSFLPYLTEEQDGPPYDLDMTSTLTYSISEHGAVEEIVLPEGALQS
jgi:hypothetical protein